jgi:hypothetical protein
MSHRKHGIIPTNEQLLILLQDISNIHYDGLFAPGTTLYDEHRPPGWRQARAICRAYGQNPDRQGWRNTCRAVGLYLPVATRGVTFDPAIKEFRSLQPEECALDWPLEQLAEMDRQFSAGMEALVRQRPVRAWDIRAKRYVVIGYQEVYELR